MRRVLYYSLLGCLLLLGNSCRQQQRTDWQIGLKRDGKKPYDLYLAYHSVSYYFPEASVAELSAGFEFININSMQGYGQQGHSLLVLSGRSLLLHADEITELFSFIGQGNEVLIASSGIDNKMEALLMLRQQGGNEYLSLSDQNQGKDNLGVLQLDSLPGKRFGMNGRNLRSYFRINDSSALQNDSIDTYAGPYEIGPARVLGKVSDSLPNFVQYSIGNGHLTLLATPLVLSNYFLLQPGNRAYLDQVWRSIPGQINSVYWASFYIRGPETSSLDILMRHPATRWFLIISLVTLGLYVLFQLKRRQRIIPVVAQPQNSSAAFVETVGMLYFNKGDNANLALKMVQHFLEWVRSNYFMNTNSINDIFAEQLSMRSGLPPALCSELTNLIHEVRLSPQVSDDQLFRLYSIIQQFYKTRTQ